MASLKTSELHFAMFPWFAFGHMTPFLHLSNKLAKKGHKVSFLLPRGAQSTMEPLSLNQDHIHFFPLDIPQVDGLPPGTETASDVPVYNHTHLCTAMDQTQHQVQAILIFLNPDISFLRFQLLGSSLGPPSRHQVRLLRGGVRGGSCHKANAVAEFGSGLTLYDRLTTGMKECDAIAMRTCPEIEGPFCDFISQQYAKPVLLTGTLLSETQVAPLEDRWAMWLNNFKPSSVVFCALGSQIALDKSQFQELLLGFELAQLPFLVVLKPPQGCATIEEALPEGFLERVCGRGVVYGGWVPQLSLLKHPSVGCFVSHCGFGSMWESLINDCQIVLVPYLGDQVINARLMVEEMKVAVEVERPENGWVSKENLSKAIESVMDDSEVATLLRSNHATWKDIVLSQDMEGGYFDSFIQNLQSLLVNC
ncbi:hypothetical protein L1049_004947 [Liquidambar formosana]|uniref:Glycosyltransferase n=1 Tax=Liquidambar formosana TaxID=63359 RepID=A0AAP0RU88_LIQFO